jgi:predicted alpha/beta superfamily hydrolase
MQGRPSAREKLPIYRQDEIGYEHSVRTLIARKEQAMIRMLVVVQTAISLGVGEQVFLTGNIDELGRWNVATIPMTRMDDNRWEAILSLRTPDPFEFKITRGTWETEEVDAQGGLMANHVLTPKDGGTVEIRVAGWKDEHQPQPTSRIVGDYRFLPKVHSKFLEHDRDVIVWFPPGYAERPTKRYPVLYMQDGRQVFDPGTSTWGKDWQVDELAQDMILNGELEPFIVVAVDCTDARGEEYSPARKGDDYLRFLIEELKPLVDSTWRTDPERACIAGSSMGGLISFYAGWKHPDIFSGAACLSPAFVERYGHECFRMVEAARGKLPDLKIFLSCGGAAGLEAELLDGTLKMADLLRNMEYPEKKLSVRIESWAEHNEEAWSRMTPHWLRFLFGRAQIPEQDPGTAKKK